MKTKLSPIFLIAILTYLSSCTLMKPLTVVREEQLSSNWTKTPVRIVVSESKPENIDTGPSARSVLQQIEELKFFKSIGEEESAIMLNFTFFDCSVQEKAIGTTAWGVASAFTLAIIPFWHDYSMCLNISGPDLPSAQSFKTDYTVTHSVFLIGKGSLTPQETEKPIRENLILQALQSLSKMSPPHQQK